MSKIPHLNLENLQKINDLLVYDSQEEPVYQDKEMSNKFDDVIKSTLEECQIWMEKIEPGDDLHCYNCDRFFHSHWINNWVNRKPVWSNCRGAVESKRLKSSRNYKNNYEKLTEQKTEFLK